MMPKSNGSAAPDAKTTRRIAPLAMDPATFRTLGHRLVDQVAELLAGVPRGPVTRGSRPSQVRAALGGDRLPELGADPGALLDRAVELLREHSLYNGHPRFLGYITSSPAPIGILGDLLAAAVNPNVGAWELSPAASEIEAQAIRWIAELMGYPREAGGVLVSGGNMANFVCVLAARGARAPWDVRVEGMAGPGRPRLRIYASSETHTWIQKAADLFGLGTAAIGWIPVDEHFAMDTRVLGARIAADRAAGDRPFMVVGTAGSVSTGAVDPLREIGAICREHDLWFHVDGAYGGFAAALPDAPADLAALAGADSVAVDPHKWLYTPLEAGCALVRDREALQRAFSYHPPYYFFGDDPQEPATNYVDHGPQNSRGFRALKVWLGLQHAGRDGAIRMIADDVRLARVLFDAVGAHPELERFTCSLSIATFRFVPPGLREGGDDAQAYLDELNSALNLALKREGRVFLSNAVLRGRFVQRACIVNFHTDLDDVLAVPETVARAGRELDARMRPAALRTR